MIVRGNTKLGPGIWTWSIPAAKTCPGASPVCLSCCYGFRGRYRMANTRDAHNRNYLLSLRDDFASRMSREIFDNAVAVLRIHAVGDFYSPEYVEKWRRIVSRNRRTTFYCYTRSWAMPEIKAPLLSLTSLPNFRLWLSWDMSMPVPPRVNGVRRCYLSTSDEDLPNRGCADLIFRENQKTKLKRGKRGELVCPYDNGVTATTCSHCKLCWQDNVPPAKKIIKRESKNVGSSSRGARTTQRA